MFINFVDLLNLLAYFIFKNKIKTEGRIMLPKIYNNDDLFMQVKQKVLR